MEFLRAVGWAKGHQTALSVVAFIFLVAAADLLVNRPKGEGIQWFSLPLMAVGAVILALLFWPTARAGPRVPADTLAHRLLRRVTLDQRLVPFFPIFGIAAILADLAFNAFISATPALLTHDQAILFFGGTLLAYRFVPGRYERERDFVFLFAAGLTAVLVIPLVVLRLSVGNEFVSVDAYSTFALAPQTSAVLNWLGIHSSVVFVPPEPSPGLSFTTAGGLPVTVFITSACSGVYSVAIFASAFAAFVLTEQRRFTLRVALFFVLGVVLAYIANILRMVAIVGISYAYDTPASGARALLDAHSNLGWAIFLLWIALFWSLLFRFLPLEVMKPSGKEPARGAPEKRGTFCGVCGVVLTPAIPAAQCRCGRFHHLECLVEEGQCPTCHTPFKSRPVADQPAA